MAVDIASRLRALGARWDPARAVWVVPLDRRDDLAALLRALGLTGGPR
jgi:hypothetical protein